MTVSMASADLDDTDRSQVLDVMRSGRLTMGPKTEEFERLSAEYCGARHAVAVNSGTAALHLLSVSAGIEPGDEVITTSFSFVASTNCFLYLGATPVFVDIEPETYCINPALIAQAVTPRTKAIIAVDVFGHPADWDALTSIARDHGLQLITDSCESLGAEYRGRKTGPFGCGGAFAYFPNKQITTGEGGMIVTNDEHVHHLCRSLRNQGRDESGPWLEHAHLGYNYRIDELSAALGISQMQKLESFVAKRAGVAARYDALLRDEPLVKIPRVKPDVRMSYFVYVVEIAVDAHRQEVMQRLAARGIPSRGYFSPIHHQPYVKRLGLAKAVLPVTEAVSAKTIALPFHNNLSDEEIEYVASGLRSVLREFV